MSDQLKNILLWGSLGLVAVLSFILINNAIADEAADAERDTRAPYLTRVLSHVIKQKPVEVMEVSTTTAPAVVPAAPRGK
jgi:hypothetical protein